MSTTQPNTEPLEDSAKDQEAFVRVHNPPKVYPTGYVKREEADPLPYYTVGGAGTDYAPDHPSASKVRQTSRYHSVPHLVPHWRKEGLILQSPLIHDKEAARLYAELSLFSGSRIF
ncbi:unnamed protein product, partial [Dibothriocephalus latus]